MAVRIQIRRDSQQNWNTNNPILKPGELAFSTDVKKFKVGFSENSRWQDCEYVNLLPSELVEAAQDAIRDAVNHNDHSHISVTYDDVANKLIFSTNPDVVISGGLDNTLEDYVTLSYFTNLLDSPNGIPQLDNDGLILETQIPSTIARDSEVSTVNTSLTNHTSATTSVHGIADTADLATKSYADAAASTAAANLVNSAPAALDTLKELSDALGADANFATTVSNSIGLKAPIESPTFTGTVSGITKAMVGLGDVDNTTDINKPVSTATQTALNNKLDSSAFTYAGITIPVYTAVGDLPSAADNHGRWAHIHGEGAMYYAHGGSWYRALSQTDLYVSKNAQAGSYTLSTTDLGKMIEMSGGGTLTISDSASFPDGFTANILQTGGSQVNIAGSGFTPNATPGLKLRAQWSSATILKRSLNSWVVMGDLSV